MTELTVDELRAEHLGMHIIIGNLDGVLHKVAHERANGGIKCRVAVTIEPGKTRCKLWRPHTPVSIEPLEQWAAREVLL